MKCTKTLHPPTGGSGKGEKHLIQHILVNILLFRFDHLRGTESPVLALGHFPAKEEHERLVRKTAKPPSYAALRRTSPSTQMTVGCPSTELCLPARQVETSAEVDF